MSTSGRPAGVPDDAVEMSVDDLVALAEKDPSMRALAARAVAARNQSAAGSAPAAKPKKGPVPVVLNGREIYRWEQTLDEVLIYVPRPPGVPGKGIDCRVTADNLFLGIKGSDKAYINEPLGSAADPDESLMMIEDDNIVVTIQKASPGEVWPAALAAHARLDSEQVEAARKAVLLERFQREHPGFDFSGATISGDVPDAREFMGGIDHNKIRGSYR